MNIDRTNINPVLNFIFLDDIILLKNLNNINNIKFKVVEILYFPTGGRYTIKLERIVDNNEINNEEWEEICLCFDLYSDSPVIKYIYINSDYIKRFDDNAIEEIIDSFCLSENIISRNKEINDIVKEYYCKSLCFLSLNKLCNSMDKLCEYYEEVGDNKNNIPFIGDRVNYFRGKVPSTGTIIRLKERGRGIKGPLYGILNDQTGEYHSIISPVTILKRNSILVPVNPCKKCILNSCDSCRLKFLKDLNIIQK